MKTCPECLGTGICINCELESIDTMIEDDDDNTDPDDNPETTQEEAQAEQPPMPTIPPLRTFRVTRYTTYGNMEDIIVEAHSVQTNERANLLQFIVCAIDPVAGPGSYVRRAFNGWDSYTEVLTAPVLASTNLH